MEKRRFPENFFMGEERSVHTNVKEHTRKMGKD